MKSFLFRLRFAFKNIIKYPGRSLVIFFTLFLAMAMLILTVCMNDAFTQMTYYRAKEKYLNIDLTLTYDSNSNSRIINKRKITETYFEYYDGIACFFNYYSLSETSDETFYSQVFSSSISEFGILIDSELDPLGTMETYITESIAEKYDLLPGDTVGIYVSDQKLIYTVKAILKDKGLFKDDAIFVDKLELMQVVYSIFTPLTNLGNIIYFDLKEGVSEDDFIAVLKNDISYQEYVGTKTIDYDNIRLSANNFSAMFAGVGAIILIALLLVLNSLFPLLFKDFRSQIGIIQVLGGNNRFSLSIWIMQFAMYSALAIPLGVYAGALVLNQGSIVMGINSPIFLDFLQIGFSVLGFLIIIGFETIFRYNHLCKQSSVALSYDRRSEKIKSSRFLVIATGVLLILELIFAPFDEKTNAAIIIGLALMVSFSIINFVLEVYGVISSRKKSTSLFQMFGAKNLKNNLIIHNSLKVAVISIIVIVLTLTVRSIVQEEADTAAAELQVDYILTNIVDYSDSLKTTIENEYAVDSMDEAILYRNIYMNFTSGNESDRRSIGYVASLPFEKISTYFGFDFQGTVAEKFSSTEIAYIVLPLPTAKIYGVEIGDEIRLELSRENPEETFVVAGYIDSNYMGFAFTNMYNLARYDSMELYNTLLINDGQDQTIKRGLMKTYNSAMYFLIDTDEMLAKTAEQAFDLTNYLTIISLAVAFAFIFVIINNSLLVFYSLRSDYAKLKVLGVSTKELMKEIVQEVVFSIIVVFTISFGCSFLLIPNLGPFMLYFKYFRTIETGVLPLLSRVGIGSLAFVFSYSFYFFKIRSMNVIQEIKKY